MTARHLLLIFELSAGNCVFIDPIHHEYKVGEEKFYGELLVLFFIINSGCCCCTFPLPHLKLIKNLPPSFWYPKKKLLLHLYKYTHYALAASFLRIYLKPISTSCEFFQRDFFINNCSISTTILSNSPGLLANEKMGACAPNSQR